jgi:hypothetical protein
VDPFFFLVDSVVILIHTKRGEVSNPLGVSLEAQTSLDPLSPRYRLLLSSRTPRKSKGGRPCYRPYTHLLTWRSLQPTWCVLGGTSLSPNPLSPRFGLLPSRITPCNVPTLGHHHSAEVYDYQSSQMGVIASTGVIERHSEVHLAFLIISHHYEPFCTGWLWFRCILMISMILTILSYKSIKFTEEVILGTLL